MKRNNEVEEIFKRVDRWVNYLNKKNRFGKDKMYWLIYYELYECDNNEIDEYVKTRGFEDFE